MITSIFLLACFFLDVTSEPYRSIHVSNTFGKVALRTQDKKNRENQITTRFSPGLMPRQFPLPTIYMLPII